MMVHVEIWRLGSSGTVDAEVSTRTGPRMAVPGPGDGMPYSAAYLSRPGQMDRFQRV